MIGLMTDFSFPLNITSIRGVKALYEMKFEYAMLINALCTGHMLGIDLVNSLVELGLAAAGRAARRSGGRFSMKRGFVEGLGGWRYIQGRVLGKEAVRAEHDADALHGHDREVLDTRIMSQTKS